MKKIKILYGIEASGGGAFKHVTYLASNLPKDKFDVTLVYSTLRKENISKELKILKESNVKLIPLKILQSINILSDFKVLIAINKLFKINSFDIIHAHSSKAGFLFRIVGLFKKKIRIYYTPHCFHFQSKMGISKKASILYERLMSLFTTKIIVSSSELFEAEKKQIASKSKFKLINNAVSFDEFKLEKEIEVLKKKYGICISTKYIVGGVGRLEPQKDWNTFIKVALTVIKEEPNTTFLIAGEGSQYDYLKKRIFQLGLENKILLIGYTTKIHEIYNIVDILLSTSLWEGLPYVALEASLYNKPMVSTRAISGEIPLLNKTCPCKDYGCLSKEILKNIRANGKQKKCPENLYNKSSFQFFLKRHIEMYHE